MLDLDAIADVVAGAVREATAPLLSRIDALEKRELLLPEKGDPGEPGRDGEKGEPGEVDMDRVKALVDEAVATLPPAAPGPEGPQGPAGEKGLDGADGRDGADGKDGAGLSDAFVDKDGHLVLTMTDGRTKTLCNVIGKDGDPGKDGADGITPEFLEAEFEGRVLKLSFNQGGETRTVEFQFATPEYRGVFKDGEGYEPGDFVTWAGSLWHCDEATKDKPGTDCWSLAVKKGRDGKDAGK